MSDVPGFAITLRKADWDPRTLAWRLDALRVGTISVGRVLVEGEEAKPSSFDADTQHGQLRWVAAGEDPPKEVHVQLKVAPSRSATKKFALKLLLVVVPAVIGATALVMKGGDSRSAAPLAQAPAQTLKCPTPEPSPSTSQAQECLRGYAPACTSIFQEARAQCDADVYGGCTFAATFLTAGRLGVAKDPHAAQKAYEKSCAGGDAAGCYGLGNMFMNRVVVESKPRAYELFVKACDAGYQPGCANKAYLLEKGDGVTQDLSAAVALYRDACTKGEMSACSNLGYLHQTGVAVPSDPSIAVGLYTSACDAGIGAACRNLGVLHERGLNGVAENADVARKLYERSCGVSDGVGCTFLGNIYADGVGVQTDLKLAFRYFMSGCELNDRMGCNNVAVAYENGEGTEQSFPQAFTYYDLACTKGYDAGCVSAADLMRDGRVKRDNAILKQYEDKARALRAPPAP